MHTYLMSNFVGQANVSLINYSDNKGNAMSTQIGGVRHRVYGPGDVDVLPPPAIVIVFTGSMNVKSPYVNLLLHILHTHKSLFAMFVWGGFAPMTAVHAVKSDVLKEYESTLSFLQHRKVVHVARCARDLTVAKYIMAKSAKRRARLGGDPMCLWYDNFKNQKQTRASTNVCMAGRCLDLRGKRVLIHSLYAERYAGHQAWSACIASGHFDAVVYIDTHADSQVALLHPCVPHAFFRDPVAFLSAIEHCSHVVSNRLHGGVLSALCGVPTTMVITDSREAWQGTYKFEAVSNTASGYNRPLCSCSKALVNLETLINVPPADSYTENVQAYLRLTNETLLFMKRIIQWHQKFPACRLTLERVIALQQFYDLVSNKRHNMATPA